MVEITSSIHLFALGLLYPHNEPRGNPGNGRCQNAGEVSVQHSPLIPRYSRYKNASEGAVLYHSLAIITKQKGGELVDSPLKSPLSVSIPV